MIVKLNGFTINDPQGTTGVYLDETVDGLDLPIIRTSSGDYASRNGGYVGAQFFGARSISLKGRIFANDLATVDARRKALQVAVGGGLIQVDIILNSGAAYLLYAYVTDLNMPIPRDPFSAPYKLELLAPDPTIYDNSSGSALTTAISKKVSGGYTYPVVFPVVYAAGTQPATVTNSGTVTVYPQITLTGAMTNPAIQNVTTNQLFSLSGLVTGAADTVVIDMLKRTVTLNGASIFGLIAASSTFWGLIVGNNSVQLTTSNAGDTVTGVVSWRSGVMGV